MSEQNNNNERLTVLEKTVSEMPEIVMGQVRAEFPSLLRGTLLAAPGLVMAAEIAGVVNLAVRPFKAMHARAKAKAAAKAEYRRAHAEAKAAHAAARAAADLGEPELA